MWTVWTQWTRWSSFTLIILDRLITSLFVGVE